MKIFDAMSDSTVHLFGTAFWLAFDNRFFEKRLIELGIMTEPEIRRFVIDMKNLVSAHVTRRHLEKIVASVEEYDKRVATFDIVNAVQARIDFRWHILEEQA